MDCRQLYCEDHFNFNHHQAMVYFSIEQKYQTFQICTPLKQAYDNTSFLIKMAFTHAVDISKLDPKIYSKLYAIKGLIVSSGNVVDDKKWMQVAVEKTVKLIVKMTNQEILNLEICLGNKPISNVNYMHFNHFNALEKREKNNEQPFIKNESLSYQMTVLNNSL